MEFYAEISKRMLSKIEQYGFPFKMPSGVRMSRKKRSRACYFTCADDQASEDLVELLDQYGISWQEND